MVLESGPRPQRCKARRWQAPQAPLNAGVRAGPLLLRALISQDMYLAGSFILLMGVLTLIGMLVSDLLLALLDPRIRFT